MDRIQHQTYRLRNISIGMSYIKNVYLYHIINVGNKNLPSATTLTFIPMELLNLYLKVLNEILQSKCHGITSLNYYHENILEVV